MVESDEQIILAMLSYFPLIIRHRNLRRLLFNRLKKYKLLQYTPQSHNPIIREILCYNDLETKKHLRISETTFREIVNYLPRTSQGWSSEIELMTFLLWLANGSNHKTVAKIMEMPKTSVLEIVGNVLNYTLKTLMPQVINLPNANELDNIGTQFSKRGGTSVFQNVVGVIDGAHISYQCPVHLKDQYINRKKDYSIQCQAICDANLRFFDVFIGYPGSIRDIRVLQNSTIFKKKLYPPAPYIILGDHAYPCTLKSIRIITPFKRSRRLTVEQVRFNRKHSKARNTVELAFRNIKRRWSIFERPLRLNIENSVKTIAACCALHNICVNMKDDTLLNEENDEMFFEEDRECYPNNDEITGVQYRDSMVARI